jgi:hypothetical protein
VLGCLEDDSKAQLAKEWHEGKADVSAEHAAPAEGTRISGEDELQEWAFGAQETAGQGAQAPYGQQRVALLRPKLRLKQAGAPAA